VWSEGNGEQVILHLHGLGGDHSQAFGFTPSAEELGTAGGGWRRVAVDMRGHGETRALGEAGSLTFDAFADDAVAVLRSLGKGARPAVIVGMSMGAEVALHIASRAPELVRALVLIRPAFAGGVVSNNMLPIYRLVKEHLQRDGVAGVSAFVRTPEYRSIARLSEQTAASLARQFERPGAVERAEVLTAVPSSPALPLAEVQLIDHPAIVLVSPEDPAHPMTCGRLLADSLPNAGRLVILPKKAAVPGPHEEQMRATVASFLRQLEARALGDRGMARAGSGASPKEGRQV
jgi:pimeloyl-ACP methyl ester carboxylesterase